MALLLFVVAAAIFARPPAGVEQGPLFRFGNGHRQQPDDQAGGQGPRGLPTSHS